MSALRWGRSCWCPCGLGCPQHLERSGGALRHDAVAERAHPLGADRNRPGDHGAGRLPRMLGAAVLEVRRGGPLMWPETMGHIRAGRVGPALRVAHEGLDPWRVQ